MSRYVASLVLRSELPSDDAADRMHLEVRATCVYVCAVSDIGPDVLAR